MNIGIEAQRISRRKKHGMDIVAMQLVRNLQQLDTDNHYTVFIKEDEDNDVIRESKNVSVVRLKSSPYPYWEQVTLPAAVRESGVELLHCTSNTAPVNVNVPLVVTVHDIIYLEQLNLTRGTAYQIAGNLYRRWNVPPVMTKASRIITVSEYERERIISHFRCPEEKVVTIYNGVASHFRPVEDFDELQRIRIKYQLPEKFIFFLGNTDPKKNVEGVLRALSILRERTRLNFKLVMLDIDRTILAEMCERIGDTDVLDHIHLPGYVPNSELPAIYSLATLFLYPSLRESFGIPILEAMACGAPVITSDTSSMPEVAGDAAVFVDPYDPETIANSISMLLENPSLQQVLRTKGLKRFSRFSWKQNAIATMNVYKNVLQTKKIKALKE